MTQRTPVTFKDVAVYFSEEEWRLLEEWEKQLYSNVLQEIHGALISLGYAIVNPENVFRIKKTDETYTRFRQPLRERKHCLKASTGSPAFNPDLLLRVKTEKEDNCSDQHVSGETQRRNGLNTALDNPVIGHEMLLQTPQGEPQAPKNGELNTKTSTSYADVCADLMVIVKEEEAQDTDHLAAEGKKFPVAPQVRRSVNQIPNTRLPSKQPVAVPLQESSPERSKEAILPPSAENVCYGKANTAFDQRITSTNRISTITDWEETVRQIMPIIQEGHISAEQANMWIEYAKCFNQETTDINQQGTCMEARLYPCAQCDKSFSKNSSLIRHKRTHMGKRPYPTTDYTKSFEHHPSPSQHKRVSSGEEPCQSERNLHAGSTYLFPQGIHSAERQFACTDCEQPFIYRSTLLRHKRSHCEDKQYKCPDCGKVFIDNRNFRRHLRTHTGERPYACTDCNKSFSHSSNMKRHQKTHLRERGLWDKDIPSRGSSLEFTVLPNIAS